MLDKELKELIDQCREALAQGKTMKEQVDTILAWGAEKGRLSDIEKAIKQLETDAKAQVATIEQKIAQVTRQMYAPDGSYRGVWGNEARARAFGLFVMAKCSREPELAKRFDDALKKEFPDVHGKAMASDPASAGGALIIPEFSARLVRLVEQFGVMEEELFQMPMSSDTLTFMRRTGGVSVFLVGENTAGTDSQPTFANVTLTAKEWGTLTYYPKTLTEDAAAQIGELVAIEIAYAFAEKFDDIAINGDGSAGYFGVTGLIKSLTNLNGVDDGGGITLGTGSQSWAALTLGDHEKLLGRAPTYAHGMNNEVLGGTLGGKWVCSLAYFWNVMARLSMSVGGVTAGEIEGKRKLMFLGYPVKISQKMPVAPAASKVSTLFGVPRLAATVGRRRDITVEQSSEYKFAERQVTVLGTRRVAMSVHDVGTTTAAGPISGLITGA